MAAMVSLVTDKLLLRREALRKKVVYTSVSGINSFFFFFFNLAASVSSCAKNTAVETPYESKHCISLRTALICHTHPRFLLPE